MGVSAFCFGIPSESCVKCLYIEKERIPAVWTVFLIFVITEVFFIGPSFPSFGQSFLSLNHSLHFLGSSLNSHLTHGSSSLPLFLSFLAFMFPLVLPYHPYVHILGLPCLLLVPSFHWTFSSFPSFSWTPFLPLNLLFPS